MLGGGGDNNPWPFDFILYLINLSKSHHTFILYCFIFKNGKNAIFLWLDWRSFKNITCHVPTLSTEWELLRSWLRKTMKRILISDVYHVVLGNKNICLLAKPMHIYIYITVFISLYYQKSFLYQNSVVLCLSHLLPLSTKYILTVLQRRNLATVTVIKLFFLLFQNSSMYMHSSGTNHLVLADYNPQLSSSGL